MTELVLERLVPLPPDAVWRARTEPELLKRWFTPAPWQTVEADIDPRPGGAFRTAMLGPDGTRYLARAVHRDADTAAAHDKMGFHEGWGAALTQLVQAVSQGAKGHLAES